MTTRNLPGTIATFAMAACLALPALAVSPTPTPDDAKKAAQYTEQQRQEAERQRQLAEKKRQEIEMQVRKAERQMREAERQMKEAARQLAEIEATHRSLDKDVRRYVFFGQRARLGVVLMPESDPNAAVAGAKVIAVTPGGPAEEAGVKAGDVIVTFDGKPLAGAKTDGKSTPAEKLVELADGLKDGDVVALEVRRGDETKAIKVTARKLDTQGLRVLLDTADVGDIDVPVVAPVPPAPPKLGKFEMRWVREPLDELEMVGLNPDLGAYFGTTNGLLVLRVPKKFDYKLKSGDVILKIGTREPETPSQALRIIRSYDAGEKLVIEILRDKKPMTLSVEVPKHEADDSGQLWNVDEPLMPADPAMPARPLRHGTAM